MPIYKLIDVGSELRILISPVPKGQTKRDYTTRREFFVFKSKQNRQWNEILQDMQTKSEPKLLICCCKFRKSGKVLTLNHSENSEFARHVTKSCPICVGLKARSTTTLRLNVYACTKKKHRHSKNWKRNVFTKR